jgi:hypothetical protein
MLLILLAVYVVQQHFLEAGLPYLMMMIRMLQLTVHLPLFRIAFPAVSMLFV